VVKLNKSHQKDNLESASHNSPAYKVVAIAVHHSISQDKLKQVPPMLTAVQRIALHDFILRLLARPNTKSTVTSLRDAAWLIVLIASWLIRNLEFWLMSLMSFVIKENDTTDLTIVYISAWDW
jgi:threonine/homoserine efflux transporter RhtA